MAICELCRKSSKHKELLMAEYWWKGCKWCRSSDDWPSDVKTKATSKAEKEEIITREVMTSTTQKSGIMDEILQRCSYWNLWESHHVGRDSCMTARS